MFVWDEKKREANLIKHGFDFEDATLIFLDLKKYSWSTTRNGEKRHANTAFVELYRIHLTLVCTERYGDVRVISLRQSSRKERVAYSQFHKPH